MTKLFVEIRPVEEPLQKPRFVLLEEINSHAGFRGLYAVDEETKTKLERCAKGCHAQNVLYSDTLFIDLGQDTTGLDALREQSIGAEVYDDGNGNIHVHIPIDLATGPDLRKSQWAWVKRAFPSANLRLYDVTSVIRIPGTYHESNPGARKHLIETIPGDPPDMTIPLLADEEHPVSTDAELYQRYQMNLMKLAKAGQRHRHISCHLVKDAARLGLSEEACIRHIQAWNQRFCPEPLRDEEIEERVSREYSKVLSSRK